MTIHDTAIERIKSIIPGASCRRAGMCVLVRYGMNERYVMPESLQGLDDSQAAGLVLAMMGVRA